MRKDKEEGKEIDFMSIASLIKRHPVMTYFALAFTISWGGVLIVIGPGSIPGTIEQTKTLFLSVYLVTIAGPSVAGILLTVFVFGKAGLRDIVSRLFRWRVGARWYAVALLTAPLSVMATLLALSIFSPEFLPGILTTGDKASLLQFGLTAGLITCFFEELGWTGFAIPQISKRYGVLATGLFVGILWGAWHFLSNYWGIGTSSGTLSPILFMPAILFSFLPPYRVLMVWVYDHTKSLFVAMIMHASLVTFWLISTPLAIAGVTLVTWYIAWAVGLWVIAGIIVLKKKINFR